MKTLLKNKFICINRVKNKCRKLLCNNLLAYLAHVMEEPVIESLIFGGKIIITTARAKCILCGKEAARGGGAGHAPPSSGDLVRKFWHGVVQLTDFTDGTGNYSCGPLGIWINSRLCSLAHFTHHAPRQRADKRRFRPFQQQRAPREFASVPCVFLLTPTSQSTGATRTFCLI